jgi:hypothetical protein
LNFSLGSTHSTRRATEDGRRKTEGRYHAPISQQHFLSLFDLLSYLLLSLSENLKNSQSPSKLLYSNSSIRMQQMDHSGAAAAEQQVQPQVQAQQQQQQQQQQAAYYDVQTQSQQQPQQAGQYSCLYTKQKTQKRKQWHDGRLVLSSNRAVLHNANPAPGGAADAPLAECEITNRQTQALVSFQENRLETEKFLIQIEGPWIVPLASLSTGTTEGGGHSAFTQKLLRTKFQKPKAYIPPPLTTTAASRQQSQLQAVLGKRRRPLQPGELQRLHHGTASPPPPPQHHQQHQQHHQQQQQYPHAHSHTSSDSRPASQALNNPYQQSSYQRKDDARPTPPRTATNNPTWNNRAQPFQADRRAPPPGHSPFSMGTPTTTTNAAPSTQHNHEHEPNHDDVPSPFALSSSYGNYNNETNAAAALGQPNSNNRANPPLFASSTSRALHNNEFQQGNSSNNNQPNQQSRSLFTSNEFNAISFYGEEEEDDEQEPNPFGATSPENPHPFSNPPPVNYRYESHATPNTAATTNSSFYGEEEQEPNPLGANVQENPFSNCPSVVSGGGYRHDSHPHPNKDTDHPRPRGGGEDHENNKTTAPASKPSTTSKLTAPNNLSGNQLLALFGAGPAQPPSSPEPKPKQAEENSNNDNNKENGNQTSHTARPQPQPTTLTLEKQQETGTTKENPGKDTDPTSSTFEFVLPPASDSSSSEEDGSSQED